MSHENRIFDIKGFECKSGDGETCLLLECALGENDRSRLEELDDESKIPVLEKAYDEIKKFDGNIGAVMSCAVSGSEPMAIGWFEPDFPKATNEKMEKLKGILIQAGFEVESIEKDRFISYG